MQGTEGSALAATRVSPYSIPLSVHDLFHLIPINSLAIQIQFASSILACETALCNRTILGLIGLEHVACARIHARWQATPKAVFLDSSRRSPEPLERWQASH